MHLCLGLSLVLSIIAGFIPIGREFSFQRTFAFYPYFLLGYYMRHKEWMTKLRGINYRWCCAVILIYVVAIAVMPHIPLSMLVQFHYYSELGNIPVALAMRCASYLWMLPLTLAVIAVIPDVKWMAKDGSESLFFYVYHAFLIGVLHLIVLYWHIPTSFITIVLYTVVIALLLHLANKVKVLRLLSKPM